MWKGIILFWTILFIALVSPAIVKGGVEGLLEAMWIAVILLGYSLVALVILVIGVNLLGAFSKGKNKEMLSLEELKNEVLHTD